MLKNSLRSETLYLAASEDTVLSARTHVLKNSPCNETLYLALSEELAPIEAMLSSQECIYTASRRYLRDQEVI